LDIRVQKYQPSLYLEWNHFIKSSVAGTFLFYRDFMDYHKERFEDHSLMFYKEDHLICCIPSHIKNQVFYSHRGLSYGGWILNEIGIQNMHLLLDVFLEYIKDVVFSVSGLFVVKAEVQLPPTSYHKLHEEMIVILRHKGFKVNRILDNLFVKLDQKLRVSPKKTRGYRNGEFAGLKIERSNDFKRFWVQVLVPQLRARYATKPVHSLEEIELLASNFPKNIVQHNLYREDQLLAGITFFIKNDIVKSQYTASSSLGLKINAVGYLYMEAMKEFQEKGFLLMDYGSVNERDGSVNKGLLRFKKELGCEQEEWKRWEIEF
jgi:hypothetical protein